MISEPSTDLDGDAIVGYGHYMGTERYRYPSKRGQAPTKPDEKRKCMGTESTSDYSTFRRWQDGNLRSYN